MLRAYKYRIYPTEEQKTLFAKTFGCCRYIYNWGLDIKKKTYEETKKSVSRFDLNKMVTTHKKENEWLKEVDSTSLIYSIANLDMAYQNFFKLHRGYPKFKSKYDSIQSYQTNGQSVRIDFRNNKVKLLKTGWIKCIAHRKFIGTIKTTTVSRNASGQYYISILVDNGIEAPTLDESVDTETTIGIDMGIKNLAILSDGTKYDKNCYLKKSEKRLKRIQRSLSRKVKGSNNYGKEKIKLARIHQRIKNQREDYISNVTSDIVNKGCKTICIEDLNVKGMMSNHHLAKSIADASMGSFGVRLAGKCEEKGIRLIKIDRFAPSSKKCNKCGYIKKDLKLSDRSWVCPVCGEKHDRDINAAKNIRDIGVEQYSLPKCTRKVKSVECQDQKRKNNNIVAVSDTMKQKKMSVKVAQNHSIHQVVQGVLEFSDD